MLRQELPIIRFEMKILKKNFLLFSCAACAFFHGVFAQENSTDEYQEIVIDEPSEISAEKKSSLAGISEVPAAKRPKSPDAEKSRAAAEKDKEGEDEKRRETILFGTDSEILSLVQNLIANDDPRYSDELYDVFENSRSPAAREKILEYFAKFEDPCLEDYAVTILNDPYDEKNSTVEQAFRYVAAVKTEAAVPAVVALLESENESYFLPALTTLGEIGGEAEAKYLVEFLERADLNTSQRQQLMRVLGKLQALETWESLVEIAQDEGENGFVRAYAAEAIGAMKKAESVEILSKLFESSDPNLRCYVIKGISNFDTDEAKQLVIQGIKDSQYKVRLEAISAAEKMKISQAVPYLIYRAKNDSEKQVKNKAYEMLAKLGTSEADSFLLEQLSDKKSSDTVKYTIAEILLKHTKTDRAEIAGLASELVKDERRKPFCVNFGKLIAKYPESAFASVCEEYLSSKDSAVSAIGLDIYNAGNFPGAESAVRKIAEETKPSANKNKARKILKMDEEEKD